VTIPTRREGCNDDEDPSAAAATRSAGFGVAAPDAIALLVARVSSSVSFPGADTVVVAMTPSSTEYVSP